MKINSHDEYGLRILLRIASEKNPGGLSIPQLSDYEGLSSHYIAKLTRILRMAGFIKSNRGNKGGYELAIPAKEIKINDVLQSLGGTLFDEKFCTKHSGARSLCTNSIDCSIRSLWSIIQVTLDQVLDNITLHDLAGSGLNTNQTVQFLVDEELN